MELRTLRYFVATVDAGTVTAAAERLHVTQPGLSRQLRQLEQELGVDLFHRTGGRLTPTRAGQSLLPLAQDVLERADALRVAAAFHAKGRLDRLTIGAPLTTLRDVVAPFIATLDAGDPIPAVFQADGQTAGEILGRGADLAVTSFPARAPYESRTLAELPVWACVPPGHRWAHRARLRLAELVADPEHPSTAERLVLPPATFTSRISLDAALQRAGRSYSDPIEAADGTVAQALAAAGRGVAVVSDDPQFGLHALPIHTDDGKLSVRLITAWDSRHPAHTAIAAVADRLRLFVAQRYSVTNDRT
ncbi:LysR family transcriptional regulator [Kribbella sandramycini]|uniref:DNA-binding transcriptional LysR family regulator n=1 Tax=Kribbella sandramycini TaxID=60450 RepID=A0A7Y4L3A6_9ACTN|nr:LysR family transcriptional regulator [Kribbella sandramycini]MBB6570992.1 DNA-binding transcriptional LysR family regulator [Kribbella sandramycini]NOL43599.1 LysR family transcriptional regulator [Kribbella sandramycini]